MVTITLFDYIQSELIKKGFDEFVNEDGELVYFNEDYQFMTKIFKYDNEVATIVDSLFLTNKLDDPAFDVHFKKAFLYRFINRQINRQTIEAFKLELMSVFLQNERFINTVYSDMDKYLQQTNINDSKSKQTNIQQVDGETLGETNMEQTNLQQSEGETLNNNRDARAELPQDDVQLNLESNYMGYANENSISRNKQENTQQSDGETKSDTNTLQTSHQETEGETNSESLTENKVYQLDELFKTNGLLEQVYDIFDKKCFLQVW